jgi:hypothetical protein
VPLKALAVRQLGNGQRNPAQMETEPLVVTTWMGTGFCALDAPGRCIRMEWDGMDQAEIQAVGVSRLD